MEKEGWKTFINLCLRAKTFERFEEILKTFLTFEEQAQIPDRILLIKELLKGKKTQRDIAKDLKISIAKITRGSNLLKTLDPELKKYLKDSIH